MSKEERKYRDAALYRRLLSEARPYWPHIVALFLISLLASPLALLGPLPLKIVIDSVIGAKPLPAFLDALLPASLSAPGTPLLVFAIGLLVVTAVVSKSHGLGVYVLRTYIGEKLLRGFRARLFRHVQRLSLAYHDTKGTSDSIYRIQYDTASISYIAIDGVIPFITAGITVTAMIYVTVLIDWQLALVALAITPLLVVCFMTYRKRLRTGSRELKKLESGTFSVVQEVLGAVRVVKAFGQEDREEDRFVRRSNETLRARVRYTLMEGGFGLLLGFITTAGTATVLFVGAQHVQRETLTLGELLMVMSYLGLLYEPLKTISRKIGSLQSHLASAERVFALFDESPDVEEKPHAKPLARASGHVIFDKVVFAYDENRPVLHGISFEVPPRTRVGIAGQTGAGKTTLASLLTRFYDPVSGRILLDGTDLRDYKLADLRNQFGIVLQEPVLFSTSIYENIEYARPGASQEEIEAAASMANAHDFINKLPDGYETLVGERGMKLSGGERQRISLARAFLKDAPILILDEPTSSVDVKTEVGIMEALDRLMNGRTTFIIAHRLSTLESCQIRLQVENGRLVDAEADPRTETPAGPVGDSSAAGRHVAVER